MQKQRTKDKRDWIITLLFGVLSLLPISGILGVWDSAMHNPYVIFSVMVPLGLTALGMIVAAISGSRKFVKDAARIIFAPIMYLG